MFELIYTSTEKGLLEGRSGFSTVAMTVGFPPNLIAQVENQSGYQVVYQPGDANAAFNPVNYSFQRLSIGGSSHYIVSRISYAGLSYTGRLNTLAHNYLFTAEELMSIPGGAVSILLEGSNFITEWKEAPHLLPDKESIHNRTLPVNDTHWENYAGDPLWARVIAESFRKSPDNPISLQFSPLEIKAETILELYAEVVKYLTPEECLDFTFSTYCYRSAIGGNSVFLRAYPEDSTFLASIRRLKKTIIMLGQNNPVPQEWRDYISEKDAFAKEQSKKASKKELLSYPAPQFVKTERPATPKTVTTKLSRNTFEFEESNEKTPNNDLRFFLYIAVILIVALLLFSGLLLTRRNPEQPAPAQKTQEVSKTKTEISQKAPQDRTYPNRCHHNPNK